MNLSTFLKSKNACCEAIEWSEPYGEDWESAWNDCERGDWLLWILEILDFDRKKVVYAACQCVRLSLHLVPEGEERPRIAIETAEAWTRREVGLEEVKKAAYAADAAAYTADAAAYAADAAAAANAAASADAAAYAASADAADAAYAASAYAAADAADADAADADAADARKETLLKCAEIVRENVSWEEVEEHLATFTL